MSVVISLEICSLFAMRALWVDERERQKSSIFPWQALINEATNIVAALSEILSLSKTSVISGLLMRFLGTFSVTKLL